MTGLEQPDNCSLFLDNLENLMSESVKLSADVDGKLVEESIAVNIPKTWDFTNEEKNRKNFLYEILKSCRY